MLSLWRSRVRPRLGRAWRRLAWYVPGLRAPAPARLKQRILQAHLRDFGVRTFVETGTYLGDTVAAMRSLVDHTISIELSPELAARAQDRFRNLPDVEIIEGDSGEVLPSILRRLDAPAFFWLDGHWSGGMTARGEKDTPIVDELEAILGADRPHVVLVDDARCFGRDEGYPTLKELEALVRTRAPEYRFEVAADIIRILPPSR